MGDIINGNVSSTFGLKGCYFSFGDHYCMPVWEAELRSFSVRVFLKSSVIERYRE